MRETGLEEPVFSDFLSFRAEPLRASETGSFSFQCNFKRRPSEARAWNGGCGARVRPPRPSPSGSLPAVAARPRAPSPSPLPAQEGRDARALGPPKALRKGTLPPPSSWAPAQASGGRLPPAPPGSRADRGTPPPPEGRDPQGRPARGLRGSRDTLGILKGRDSAPRVWKIPAGKPKEA